MQKDKLFFIIIIALLVASTAFLGFEYASTLKQNQILRQQVKNEETNKKIVDFLNLFINKVLKTDKEVSFEDRLKLESAVRDINDPEILAQWEVFISGKNETDIQRGVKDLLALLAKKISS